jgi:hypothetical protein
MRIDSSGNVGIGTTSPAAKLQLSSSAADTRFLATKTDTSVSAQMGSEAGTAYAGSFTNHPYVIRTNDLERMRIDTSGNVGIGKTASDKPLEIYAATNPAIRIQNSTTGTTTGDGLLLEMNSSDINLYNYETGNLKFGTSNSERMRIDSGGSVFLNCTSSPTSNATAVINAIASGGDGINLKHTADGNNMLNLWQTGTTTYAAITFNKGNTQTNVGNISVSTTATAYNTSSDYRLKENIIPMTGALAKVAALKPVTYKWKLDGSDGEGFIAHELAEVCPHAVTGTKDAVYKDGNPKYQGIDTSFLVATLTAAIQELKAEFDAYKATHP